MRRGPTSPLKRRPLWCLWGQWPAERFRSCRVLAWLVAYLEMEGADHQRYSKGPDIATVVSGRAANGPRDPLRRVACALAGRDDGTR